MKYFSFISVCLFSISTFASKGNFELQINLSVDGQPVSSPKVVVAKGEKGSVVHENSGEKIFLDVVADDSKTPDGQPAIEMTFVIGKILNDGQRSILSQPRIAAIPGEKADITVGDKNQKELISLSVIANMVDLKK